MIAYLVPLSVRILASLIFPWALRSLLRLPFPPSHTHTSFIPSEVMLLPFFYNQLSPMDWFWKWKQPTVYICVYDHANPGHSRTKQHFMVEVLSYNTFSRISNAYFCLYPKNFYQKYMRNVKKWYRWSYLQSRNRDTDVENKHQYQEEMRGGVSWETETGICRLLQIK